MGPLDLNGASLATRIHFDALVDARRNTSLIAENREQADKFRPVTTSGDVAAFVGAHLKDSLHDAGLNVVEGKADVRVSAELRRFFVTEGNTYNGEITLLIHVKNRAGKDLWTGIINGDSTHWGRSFSAANYYETMSDMVLRATHNLLATGAFREALGGR
jgi:hypothetical protein